MFGWMTRSFGRSAQVAPVAVDLTLQQPTWRKGKSILADRIAEAVTASGAEPGDIVEVDAQVAPV
jgi:hypothetical protein